MASYCSGPERHKVIYSFEVGAIRRAAIFLPKMSWSSIWRHFPLYWYSGINHTIMPALESALYNHLVAANQAVLPRLVLISSKLGYVWFEKCYMQGWTQLISHCWWLPELSGTILHLTLCGTLWSDGTTGHFFSCSKIP